MGYRNVKTGNLREQRRQQRRQDVAAPVGQSSVGHGSGLRFYDGGELIIDGLNMSMRWRVVEWGGGESVAFQQFVPADMTGISAEAGLWYSNQLRALTLAGPLLHESTAAEGFGGSNLYLGGRSAHLVSGLNGPSAGNVYADDSGLTQLFNSNGSVVVNTDGAIDLFGPAGTRVALAVSGAVRLTGAQGGLYVDANGNNGLTGAGASFTGGAGGAWNTGDTAKATIQGSDDGALGLWAGPGKQIGLNSPVSVAGDFTASGAKNFVMEHPTEEGVLIRYGSTESPVSAIECRGRLTLDAEGRGVVEFPEHFTAIIKPGTDVDVSLATYGPAPSWCEPPNPTGTTVHGEPGAVVAWKGYAERIGGDFETLSEGTTAPPAPTALPDPPTEEATDA